MSTRVHVGEALRGFVKSGIIGEWYSEDAEMAAHAAPVNPDDPLEYLPGKCSGGDDDLIIYNGDVGRRPLYRPADGLNGYPAIWFGDGYWTGAESFSEPVAGTLIPGGEYQDITVFAVAKILTTVQVNFLGIMGVYDGGGNGRWGLDGLGLDGRNRFIMSANGWGGTIAETDDVLENDGAFHVIVGQQSDTYDAGGGAMWATYRIWVDGILNAEELCRTDKTDDGYFCIGNLYRAQPMYWLCGMLYNAVLDSDAVIFNSGELATRYGL